MLTKLWSALRARLVVDHWREAARLRSVQLAAFVGLLSTVVVANQGLALSLIGYLPTGWPRIIVALLIGFLAFVVPTLTRLWQQKPHD